VGSVKSAEAMQILCFIPLENLPTLLSIHSVIPTSTMTSHLFSSLGVGQSSQRCYHPEGLSRRERWVNLWSLDYGADGRQGGLHCGCGRRGSLISGLARGRPE